MILRYILLFFFIVLSYNAFTQGKSINLGYKNNGIGFGCPEKHSGFRFNLWDKDCGVINGINISINSQTKKVNGFSLGLLSVGTEIMNGFQFGTFLSVADKLNGVSIGGLFTGGKIVNGIGIAGLSVAADTLNGLFMSGIGSSYWNTDSISLINGVSIGFMGGSFTKKLNGLSIGIWSNTIGKQTGVTISAFNSARELHGVQLGLINYAGNNKKPFQKMPLINFNFRRAKSD